MEERISLREYGRRKGVSDTSVRKAIAAGYIVNGVDRTDPKKPKIIPSIADAEWSSNRSTSHERTTRTGQKNIADIVPDHIAETSNVVGATSEMVKASDNTRAAAQKVQAVLKAKMMELEYKEKLGELVSKQAVYKSLYGIGQEIRGKLMTIPDRHIDDIMASKSRNEAHLLLTNAIADVLEAMTNVETLKIN
jgi:hypothetical protein